MRIFIIVGLIVVLLQSLSFKALPQQPENAAMKEKARQYFSEMNYEEAYPLYRELLRQYTKEPEYLYCTGVCMSVLNTNNQETIDILRQAASAGYNALAWYYLGRTLHLQYYFEDAIKAYSKFIVFANAAEIKSYRVERQIEMAKNGVELTRTGVSLRVTNAQIIGNEQLSVTAEINGSGDLIKKPSEFLSRQDIKSSYDSWMFLPNYTEVNEYIYVSGYDKSIQYGLQLFRIKNINHTTWDVPELLTNVINTPYDEEYPFFDINTSTLYFSSEGHSSMGGYDIFKSVYDWNSKTWSKPENLGFPINSPFDDIAFVTDDLNRYASFASDRSNKPNQFTAYRIAINKDTTGVTFNSPEELILASQLNIVRNTPGSSLPVEDTDIRSPENDIPVQPVNKTPVTTVQTVSEYNRTLAEALQLQVKADSLFRIARDNRIMARETPDEELKKQLISSIINTERESKRYQREADSKFAKAAGIKAATMGVPEKEDSAMILAGEINGISIYQYKQPSGLSKSEIPETDLNSLTGERLTGTAIEGEVNSKATGSNASVRINDNEGERLVIDEFSILETSPYNNSNPIPKLLTDQNGLLYRIQIGAFSSRKPDDFFGGISPVFYDYIPDRNIIKYYAGAFYGFNAVNAALNKIRANGYPDAFIVAFNNGQPITTEKAKEIEFSDYKL